MIQKTKQIIEVGNEFVEKYGVEIFRLQGEGKRNKSIAQILQIHINTIQDFFKKINKRCCNICQEIKELNIDNFRIRKNKNGIFSFRKECKKCKDKIDQEYHQENKEEIKEQKKEYRQKNKEKIKQQKQQYYQKNKETIRIKRKDYKTKNKDKIRAQYLSPEHKARTNKRLRERRRVDLIFKLRIDISNAINKMIKASGGSKLGETFLLKIGYTIECLVSYLESLFAMDPKITKNNHGTYWELDHIDPQDNLKYDSMDHPNFKKAWALDNLRPLDKITNRKDGNRRTPEQIAQIKQEIADFLAKSKITK